MEFTSCFAKGLGWFAVNNFWSLTVVSQPVTAKDDNRLLSTWSCWLLSITKIPREGPIDQELPCVAGSLTVSNNVHTRAARNYLTTKHCCWGRFGVTWPRKLKTEAGSQASASAPRNIPKTKLSDPYARQQLLAKGLLSLLSHLPFGFKILSTFCKCFLPGGPLSMALLDLAALVSCTPDAEGSLFWLLPVLLLSSLIFSVLHCGPISCPLLQWVAGQACYLLPFSWHAGWATFSPNVHPGSRKTSEYSFSPHSAHLTEAQWEAYVQPGSYPFPSSAIRRTRGRTYLLNQPHLISHGLMWNALLWISSV